MTADFMEWAGLDEARWQFLQGKLRRLIETERTAAKIMTALMDDNSVGYREQIVLIYWLGYQQALLTAGPMVTQKRQVLIQGLS